MTRRLLNLLTVLSLVLSVVVATAWVRSYRWRDHVSVHARWGEGRHHLSINLYSIRGILLLTVEPVTYSDQDLVYGRSPSGLVTNWDPSVANNLEINTGDGRPWNRVGLDYSFGVVTPTLHRMTAPHALPAIGFAAAPALSALFWRRRQIRAAHHCRSCGYNLTGNVSGVCPECGKDRSH